MSETRRWTIRVCESCGCVHDRPDAGCPECGERAHEPVEVVPLSLYEAQDAVLREFVEAFDRGGWVGDLQSVLDEARLIVEGK